MNNIKLKISVRGISFKINNSASNDILLYFPEFKSSVVTVPRDSNDFEKIEVFRRICHRLKLQLDT